MKNKIFTKEEREAIASRAEYWEEVFQRQDGREILFFELRCVVSSLGVGKILSAIQRAAEIESGES